MNYEKWGDFFKWLAIPVTTFFFLMVVLGIYLGVTGQQEFTFSNHPDESVQEAEH